LFTEVALHLLQSRTHRVVVISFCSSRSAFFGPSVTTSVQTREVRAMWKWTFRWFRGWCTFFSGELAQEIFKKSEWTCFSLGQLLLDKSS
jgi:hypothetical protein